MADTDMQSSESCPHWQKVVASPLRLWSCLTSLWRHKSIKYGQGVALDNIMWCLLTAVWSFTIRPLVRKIHQAVLWLVNIDPSYDVTCLRNMLNWPPLDRFYQRPLWYLCLLNSILLGKFVLCDKQLATVNQYSLTLFDLPVTSQVKNK